MTSTSGTTRRRRSHRVKSPKRVAHGKRNATARRVSANYARIRREMGLSNKKLTVTEARRIFARAAKA